MHLAIEGIDGVGKSTICKLVAEKLDFLFVDKPLHHLFDDDGGYQNYIRIRDVVNAQSDRVFTSWFYGLGNIYLYTKFKGKNIVTDRHLLSNYCWSGTAESKAVFDLLVDKIGCPDFTFIIYASSDVVKKRIVERDKNDTDVDKIPLISEIYRIMEAFCVKYKMPYLIINSDNLTIEQEVKIIINKVKEINK